MILPHFETIIQCMDVVKELPVDDWDRKTGAEQRAAGLVARWAIEKAFEAAIRARGAKLPEQRTLVQLFHASGVKLIKEQNQLLPVVDTEVAAKETEVTDAGELYLDCCRMARGIVPAVHQHLTLAGLH